MPVTGTRVTREDVIDGYRNVRIYTEALAADLSAEDQTVQSMPDVSPTKWHRAHVTWFFETFLLSVFHADYEPVDPVYTYLFNSYYEAVGARYPRPQRGLITRPGAAEVGAYRAEVDRRVIALLDTADDELLEQCSHILELGRHHEQQHQELLLMDIKNVLWSNPARPAYRKEVTPPSAFAPPSSWLSVPGGIVDIGYSGTNFHFDNEGPRHQVLLESFRIADRLVTNGEWREFMADDGYSRPELWLSDGRAWVLGEGIDSPLYWFRDGDTWCMHTLSGPRAVNDGEPVCHVSHYEADAFATWAEARLPTEFEWEHAVSVHGSAERDAEPGQIHPHLVSSDERGMRQAFGQCWQWTASAYLGYPGFRPPPGAIGEYNGKFMSNQMVLRGSSALTSPGHSRATYRNFFPSHTRWMMSGVRLATDGTPGESPPS